MLRSERNAQWIEKYCRVPEGKKVGQKLKLTSKQRKWMAEIYDSPTRMFILSMGRKNAKTALAAFIACLHLAGPEAKPNSQIYSAARSRDQAAVLFELAAKVVRMSPDLSSVITLRDTAKEMLCQDLGTFFKALSADAATKFGLSPALVIHDELGQVKGPRDNLYEALETACAAQESPLSIVISTQAPTDNDLLSVLIDDALSGADPTIKVALYTAPKDLETFSEEAIRAANPHFDDFMNKVEVLKQSRDAERMPSRQASFENLILNRRVEAHSPFIARAIWMENGGEPDDLDGQDVYGGLDLSSVSDLTALVLVGADGSVKPTFWLPEQGLYEKSKFDRVPYDVWADHGHLQTTPGRAIEYEFIADYLRGVFDRCNVRAIAFDRYNMRFLKPWLEKIGFSDSELERFVEFGQGFVSMSPALRELESRLLQKQLRHGNHPLLTMCAANAVAVSDPAGNRKFAKNKTSGRIDGMVALAMAVGSMPSAVDDGPSVYESRGIRMI